MRILPQPFTQLLSLRLAALALALPALTLAQSWNVPNGNLPAGCKHGTFYSAANKTTIGYNIYLPPGYDADTDQRYPVVYSLHGMGGNEWGNIAYANALQSNIQSGAIKPMIWVFANGRSNTFYANSKDGTVQCETALVDELVPHIDSAYRTIPDRAHRGTNGISMGGFGALMLATKHYDLFGHASSVIAALVTWDTLSAQQFDQSIPTKIFGSDRQYFENNYYPPTFVRQNADTLKALGSSFHMADNPGDITMGPLYAYNVSMVKLLKEEGIPVVFDSTAGNGHVADYTGRSGVDILKFHSKAFEEAEVVGVRRERSQLASRKARLRASGGGVLTVSEVLSPGEKAFGLTGRRLDAFSVPERIAE